MIPSTNPELTELLFPTNVDLNGSADFFSEQKMASERKSKLDTRRGRVRVTNKCDNKLKLLKLSFINDQIT